MLGRRYTRSAAANGAVAQSGERFPRTEEVRGSTPLGSTSPADLTVWRPPGRALSAVERKPAQLVAQPLVVEHKFTDLVGELSALPPALQAAGRLALAFSRCRPRRPDRVSRGTELMCRHMAHGRGLAGSVRGMPCCPTEVSGRGVC